MPVAGYKPLATLGNRQASDLQARDAAVHVAVGRANVLRRLLHLLCGATDRDGAGRELVGKQLVELTVSRHNIKKIKTNMANVIRLAASSVFASAARCPLPAARCLSACLLVCLSACLLVCLSAPSSATRLPCACRDTYSGVGTLVHVQAGADLPHAMLH